MRILTLLCALFLSVCVCAKENCYSYERDIKYRPDVAPECLLDIAFVDGKTDRPVIVWFHGGGLTGGRRHIPEGLLTADYVIVAVEYRLYPDVKVREILQDCAESVAWVYRNISAYGGSNSKVFLAGHSAGGYITGMLGLDKQYLGEVGIDSDSLAGLGMYSAQVITHFTERKDRGISINQPIVDGMAPLYHVRGDCAPVFIATGDRNLEMVNRYEENAYFYKMLLSCGHKDAVIYEEDGYDHPGMAFPAHPLFMEWVRCRKQ